MRYRGQSLLRRYVEGNGTEARLHKRHGFRYGLDIADCPKHQHDEKQAWRSLPWLLDAEHRRAQQPLWNGSRLKELGVYGAFQGHVYHGRCCEYSL